MTLNIPHDPAMTLSPAHPHHESTIRTAIRDLQDLCGGMYDIPGGVDHLHAIADSLNRLAKTIDRGPLMTGIRLDTD